MFSKIALGMFMCAVLCGCANSATRYTLDSGEGVYAFTHEISKDQSTAYYLAEEWLSTSIRNANEAITMRQPDTGTLIANPSMQVPVAFTYFWCSYTVRITCKDKQVSTKFTLGKLDNGTYPPRDAMPGIRAKFTSINLDLIEYIEGN